ncbi:hypothetical protein ACLMJK_006393 [Lecanora helva]
MNSTLPSPILSSSADTLLVTGQHGPLSKDSLRPRQDDGCTTTVLAQLWHGPGYSTCSMQQTTVSCGALALTSPCLRDRSAGTSTNTPASPQTSSAHPLPSIHHGLSTVDKWWLIILVAIPAACIFAWALWYCGMLGQRKARRQRNSGQSPRRTPNRPAAPAGHKPNPSSSTATSSREIEGPPGEPPGSPPGGPQGGDVELQDRQSGPERRNDAHPAVQPRRWYIPRGTLSWLSVSSPSSISSNRAEAGSRNETPDRARGKGASIVSEQRRAEGQDRAARFHSGRQRGRGRTVDQAQAPRPPIDREGGDRRSPPHDFPPPGAPNPRPPFHRPRPTNTQPRMPGAWDSTSTSSLSVPPPRPSHRPGHRNRYRMSGALSPLSSSSPPSNRSPPSLSPGPPPPPPPPASHTRNRYSAPAPAPAPSHPSSHPAQKSGRRHSTRRSMPPPIWASSSSSAGPPTPPPPLPTHSYQRNRRSAPAPTRPSNHSRNPNRHFTASPPSSSLGPPIPPPLHPSQHNRRSVPAPTSTTHTVDHRNNPHRRSAPLPVWEDEVAEPMPRPTAPAPPPTYPLRGQRVRDV